MGRPVHFDITAEDPDRAAAFYKTVFGWQMDKWDGPMAYWMVTTGPDSSPGIHGGMGLRSPGEAPSTVITIDVDDLDGTVESVVASGGSVEMPRHAIPGVGWIAYFRDTEGTMFGVMQSDPNAR